MRRLVMARIPKKTADRIVKHLGKFQKVLRDAQDRDVNESDTVTIITDMLGSVFGYDKYTDVTSEQAIRGTYCDLAIKHGGVVKFIIEVKAIGLTLKENHLRQAIGYGANHGIPWIVLTNGIEWEVYKIGFEQPISCDQILAFNMLELSPRKADHQEMLYLLSKEGLAKSAIEDFDEHVQIVNRFVAAALIQSESVVAIIRRELKRLTPGTSVSTEEIEALLPDVLKRDVIDGEQADRARKQVQRATSTKLRKKKRKRTRKAKSTEPVSGSVE
jgi:hypothetical protein